MGSSISTTNNSDLYNNIIKTIDILTKEYSNDFLNKDFCDSLSLIYEDKLMNFPLKKIKNVNYKLGITYNNNTLKNNLCKNIIDYYKQRIEIMKNISDKLNSINNEIAEFLNPPYYIDENNFIVIGKDKDIKNKDKNNLRVVTNIDNEHNNDFNNQIKNLNTLYNKILHKIDDYLENNKNYKEKDNFLTEFNVMIQNLQNIINNILNIKLFSDDEIKAKLATLVALKTANP
jgi:hypothetical protein